VPARGTHALDLPISPRSSRPKTDPARPRLGMAQRLAHPSPNATYYLPLDDSSREADNLLAGACQD
jgi:hypothetical protein